MPRIPRLTQPEQRLMMQLTVDKKKGPRIYEQRIAHDYYDTPLDKFKQHLDTLAEGLSDVVIEFSSTTYDGYYGESAYSETELLIKGYRPLNEDEQALYEKAKAKQVEIDKATKQRQKMDAERAKAKREQDERKQYEALKRKYEG